MQHELGTSAVLEAGFTADAAIVTEPTSIPYPLTVSPIAAGNWYFRITSRAEQPTAATGRSRSAPEGLAMRSASTRSKRPSRSRRTAGARTAVGPHEEPPVLHARFLLASSRVCSMPTRGSTSPCFPHRAQIAYSLWYPPDETAGAVQAENEEHVCDRLPPRPVAARPSAALRVDQQLARRVDIVGASGRSDAGRGRTSGSQARRSSRPVPQHPIAFGAASDASFYEAAGIPSVVFGPGDLRIAHCKDERRVAAGGGRCGEVAGGGRNGVVWCRGVGHGRRSWRRWRPRASSTSSGCPATPNFSTTTCTRAPCARCSSMETSAVFMAMAYARVSGRVGVVHASPGPGMANLVPGLLEAQYAGSPLVSWFRQPAASTREAAAFRTRPLSPWSVRSRSGRCGSIYRRGRRGRCNARSPWRRTASRVRLRRDPSRRRGTEARSRASSRADRPAQRRRPPRSSRPRNCSPHQNGR